jgi:hypothetical protein
MNNPSVTLMGYNMYRDGLKLNGSVITAMTWIDQNVPAGEHNYCVTAVYDVGESAGTCKLVDVITGLSDSHGESKLQIYPNPVEDVLTITSSQPVKEIRISDYSGKEVYRYSGNESMVRLNVSGFPSGLYMISMITLEGTTTSKVVIR